MPIDQESPAVAVARAHVEAWSNHDFGTARSSLADDVKVTVTTTDPALPDTNLGGVDDYMGALIAFAQPVVPGSLREIASVGDERNALLMLSVETDLGGGKTTLPAARLYRLDEADKIQAEQMVFLVPIEVREPGRDAASAHLVSFSGRLPVFHRRMAMRLVVESE
jgi:hypothetical protein